MRRALPLALALAACDTQVILIDPEVKLAPVVPTDGGPSTTSLALGMTRDQLFVPIEPGGPLPVVAGFQGGRWTMPTLRIGGLLPDVRVQVAIEVSATGEKIGIVDEARWRANLTAEGLGELLAFPIPILHADRPFDDVVDVFGQPAEVDVRVVDSAGSHVEGLFPVTLEEG